MTFLKDRLFGEGDFMRHLASKGYKLHYQQDPRAEFEFGVTNLAIDLRNGMRLCKLAEQMTGRYPPTQKTSRQDLHPCTSCAFHRS